MVFVELSLSKTMRLREAFLTLVAWFACVQAGRRGGMMRSGGSFSVRFVAASLSILSRFLLGSLGGNRAGNDELGEASDRAMVSVLPHPVGGVLTP